MIIESAHINTSIALVAFLLSTYSVWLTYNFNKKQQEVNKIQANLNEILLQKEKDELASQKKADVSASIVKISKGDYRVRVCNQGKAVAKNVQLIVPPDDENNFCIDDKLPIDLHRHAKVDIFLASYLGSPSKYRVTVTWDDDYELQREKIIDLSY